MFIRMYSQCIHISLSKVPLSINKIGKLSHFVKYFSTYFEEYLIHKNLFHCEWISACFRTSLAEGFCPTKSDPPPAPVPRPPSSSSHPFTALMLSEPRYTVRTLWGNYTWKVYPVLLDNYMWRVYFSICTYIVYTVLWGNYTWKVYVLL